jgi:predicted transposase/invertase (TIGR01784 family)
MTAKRKKDETPRQLVSFDWAIKRLLRSKANFGILEGFLSELLHEDITIKELLESESNKEHKEDKFNRVDLLVKNHRGDLILIEVQYEPELDYLFRMLYGSSKLIVEHLNEGESYAHVKKVISVSLVYFELGQGDDYVYYGSTTFKGIHKHDTLILAANQMKTYNANSIAEAYPEYYIIRINEFNNIAKDPLDEWIYFLKNEALPPHAKAKGLKEAGDKLDILKLNPEQRKAYETFKENQRYRKSIVEGSIGRALKAEQDLLAKQDKRKEEEAKRKEEEAKRKGLEEQLEKALQELIKKGLGREEAKRILGLV